MKQFGVALVLLVILWACGAQKSDKDTVDVERLYRQHCVLCHGMDGKLAINGAKDLTLSPLTLEERRIIIAKGRNTMQAYEHMLSEGEIEALAAYTLKLE